MSTVSPIDLDAGDLGVEWIDGVGFRPVDGLDVYGGGKFECPVVGVYKDLQLDKVEVDRECVDLPAPPPLLVWTPVPTYDAPVIPVVYGWDTPVIYYDTSPPWFDVPCCITTTPPPSPPPPPPAHVPLDDSLTFMLILIVGFILGANFR